jgi:hypothetical protein
MSKPESCNPKKEQLLVSDLLIINNAREIVERGSASDLVVTGSHAVAMITGLEIPHNDIDVNVLTRNKNQAIATLLSNFKKDKDKTLLKKTPDRLEYRVMTDMCGPRIFEAQFVSYVDIHEIDDTQSYSWFQDDRMIIVPTKIHRYRNGIYRAKTLEYLIASWALRISGYALNQKRAVRETDLLQFNLLLSSRDFSESEVFSAMRYHPQNPENVAGETIFSTARAISNI